MNKKHVLLSLSASLVILSNSLMADKKSVELSDITVTAQKTEQNIQKVPMSVNVLDEFFIEDSGIKNTREIASYVPNLTTMHGGSRDYFSRIAIRGISNTGVGEPAVALYIDDVSYADLFAFDSPLFEVERIEVLKGPQGTLYGKNTEAGVINIITKKPSNELSGRVNLEAGDYDSKQIMASLNLPLIQDKLFLKMSALKSKRDGYIKNLYTSTDIDNHDTLSLRTNMLYKVTDNLETSLILGYQKLDDDGGFPMTSMEKGKYKNATGLSSLDEFESSFNYKGDSQAKTKTSVLKFDYSAQDYDFISITSYRDMDNQSTLDGDFSPSKNFIGFNSRELDSLSQEFRLSSTNSSSFNWIVGTYFNNENANDETGYKLDETYANMMGVPLYSEDKMKADLNSRDIAIFGQSTIRFFDDRLGLTAGLRYEKSKRSMDKRTHTFAGVNTATPMKNMEKTNSIVLPKLSLDYYINKNMMVYTTASKGYKAGGFSYAVDNKELAEFDPEISNALEIGIKSKFPNLGLTFNMAAFYTKVDDYQDRIQVNPTTIMQANVTEVDIKGLEFETSYAITNNLTLSGNFGLVSAKYGDYEDSIANRNYKDNKVAMIPKYDFNVGLKYRNPNGIFANFEALHTGEKQFDRSNEKKVESYTVYNAKIGYEQDNWDLYFGVKNITNKEYFLDGFHDTTVGYMGAVGNPRTFNVAFNYRF
ncbi:hypothetical protein CP960_05445 [Malaciobacter halophilus]|uniref:TonB-dependent receptor n=1 Tax=Malaciobacter halophilus TaxID=197482 RepID=A0A2N1J3Q6_9BACT|nr:TonB-dependent receptor [Malaciobacter halophilus]AXH08779.1 TonB-dependent siderophore receptor [Malaciobacter halophilus]PKI81191.1 hypothetical protein CP960_05445 [Malaciobacter halophilus]